MTEHSVNTICITAGVIAFIWALFGSPIVIVNNKTTFTAKKGDEKP
jgi:hypothetical protein